MSYADGKAPISVWIQTETKEKFNAFADARGLKKGEAIDEAIRDFMAKPDASSAPEAAVEAPEIPKAPEKPKARIGMRVRLPSAAFFMSILDISQAAPNPKIGSSGVTAHVTWFDGYELCYAEFPIEALVPHPDET